MNKIFKRFLFFILFSSDFVNLLVQIKTPIKETEEEPRELLTDFEKKIKLNK